MVLVSGFVVKNKFLIGNKFLLLIIDVELEPK